MAKRIIGNPTTTPMAVPDWNQDNPTKADHIKNKPTKLSQFENDLTVTVTERDYAYGDDVKKTDTLANILNDLAYRVSFNEQLVGQDLYPQLDSLRSTKADATQIVNSGTSEYTFYVASSHNSEVRLTTPSAISIKFMNGQYSYDYISGLSFNSGDTPTRFDYTASPIINWVGTDCTNVDGLSIFQPSANTHYDIVFYFNGSQFIGLVNGFVPATGNVVSV